MQLILCDPDSDFIDDARSAFAGTGVQIVQGKFQDQDGAGVLVSAANSFGIMDGGIGLAISEYFRWQVEGEIQQRIKDEYAGCQPVGTAIMIELDDSSFSALCHAPTMLRAR